MCHHGDKFTTLIQQFKERNVESCIEWILSAFHQTRIHELLGLQRLICALARLILPWSKKLDKGLFLSIISSPFWYQHLNKMSFKNWAIQSNYKAANSGVKCIILQGFYPLNSMAIELFSYLEPLNVVDYWVLSSKLCNLRIMKKDFACLLIM